MSKVEIPFQSQLQNLYSTISSCHICPKMDSHKALRLTQAVDPSMDVFIVSQALAEGQLRKSGVNFFNEGGILGNTGRNLEKFLNQFNRTVYPPKKVQLSGPLIREANPSFLSVYNSELAQCFPGKTEKVGKKGDRVPTDIEIQTCLGQNFLKQEIALIKPKLLLLMGNESRKAFYKYIAKDPRKESLNQHLEEITSNGRIPVHEIGELAISALPIQHASGANPAFNTMLTNEPLLKLIKDLLQQS